MLSTAARVTRRMTWLALVGGAAWLPVGVIIAAGLMLTTMSLSGAVTSLADSVAAADNNDKALLLSALLATRPRSPDGRALHSVRSPRSAG
jgi:hypothetical protein